MSSQLDAYYGLPKEVRFCKQCVMSNQRPRSYPEFRHTTDRKCPTLPIDDDGVCHGCKVYVNKDLIDWNQRETTLLQLLDKYRRSDGYYDCVVPGSGGKDSVFAAWLLKYKYGMHPLTVTWPPTVYTSYGFQNYLRWIDEGGFDNLTIRPNGRVHRLLTRLSIVNLLHPFQSFILGQKNLAAQVAMKYGIKLIFFGEHEAEVGGNDIADTFTPLRDKAFFTKEDLEGLYLGGVSIKELQERYGLALADLYQYLPPDYSELEDSGIQCHYLGYYVKWIPQEAYYFAVEKTGFQARPFRTEGTYSKYSSIDDKIDDLHYYTTYIKFGIGRATDDASQEIRNKHLTREEGVALVKQYDGEVPQRYLKDCLDYVGLSVDWFFDHCDKFRSPHLWAKVDGEWRLRHTVWGGGVDD